ncbi:hypothetical protein Gpo141_00004645 [Globisporangium polare]
MTTTTNRGFCDEEVDILSYLLLDEPALGAEEFFPMFPSTSLFPEPQYRGAASLFSVQELFGPDLLAPLDAAEFSFMNVHAQAQTTTTQHDSNSSQVYTSGRAQRSSTSTTSRDRLSDAARKKAQDEAAVNSHSRICSISGCIKSSQSRGRCIRHGGGKRCSVPECTRGAQATGRCKAHGGGVRCSVNGCEKSSQGSGLCRTHGGGKICVFPGCKKGTQRGGKCSTHGGARICSVDGCEKVDRGGGLCGAHKKVKAHKAASSAGNK